MFPAGQIIIEDVVLGTNATSFADLLQVTWVCYVLQKSRENKNNTATTRLQKGGYLKQIIITISCNSGLHMILHNIVFWRFLITDDVVRPCQTIQHLLHLPSSAFNTPDSLKHNLPYIHTCCDSCGARAWTTFSLGRKNCSIAPSNMFKRHLHSGFALDCQPSHVKQEQLKKCK